jgi:hypothetical protein
MMMESGAEAVIAHSAVAADVDVVVVACVTDAGQSNQENVQNQHYQHQ